jgi:hypothetical protein
VSAVMSKRRIGGWEMKAVAKIRVFEQSAYLS